MCELARPTKVLLGAWICLAVWFWMAPAHAAGFDPGGDDSDLIVQQQIWARHMKAGQSALDQRSYVEAEKSLKAAVGAAKAFGPRDGRLGTSLALLALAYCGQGKVAEAEPYARRAQPILETTLGPDHALVAFSLLAIGASHLIKFEPVQAEPVLQRALAIAERSFGPDHPYAAIVLATLGQTYVLKIQPQRAEPLLERALQIAEKREGVEVLVAQAAVSLADFYSFVDRGSGADPLYRRALLLLERARGPEGAEVGQVLEKHAALLRKMNREAEAVEMEARARAIRDKHTQEDSSVQ